VLYFTTSVEQRALKIISILCNTKSTFKLETNGRKSYNQYLNAVHFFQHCIKLYICGSLWQLFSCIGIYGTQLYWEEKQFFTFQTWGINQSLNIFLQTQNHLEKYLKRRKKLEWNWFIIHLFEKAENKSSWKNIEIRWREI